MNAFCIMNLLAVNGFLMPPDLKREQCHVRGSTSFIMQILKGPNLHALITLLLAVCEQTVTLPIALGCLYKPVDDVLK